MSRATTHRTSQAEYDGKQVFRIDIVPRTTVANSTQKFSFLNTFAAKLVRADLVIITQATHATAAVAFGKESDLDSVIDDVDIHSLAAGNYSLFAYPLGVDGNVLAENTVYTFSVTSGDTTGVVSASLVIEPT